MDGRLKRNNSPRTSSSSSCNDVFTERNRPAVNNVMKSNLQPRPSSAAVEFSTRVLNPKPSAVSNAFRFVVPYDSADVVDVDHHDTARPGPEVRRGESVVRLVRTVSIERTLSTNFSAHLPPPRGERTDSIS